MHSYKKKPPSSKSEKRENDRLLFGVHAVRAALENQKRVVKNIWVTDNALKQIEATIDPDRHPTPIKTDRKIIEKKLPPHTVHQGIVIDTDPLEETFLSDIVVRASQREKMTLVVLDQVTDPHNIGAILRSMSAFGAAALIVHKRHAPPITGTIAKIATGAVEHIPVIRVQNLGDALEELKSTGFTILGMSEHADQTIDKKQFQSKNVLVMGAEGKGMRQKTESLCDALIKLPTQGPIQSLNVSVATAIALFALHKG